MKKRIRLISTILSLFLLSTCNTVSKKVPGPEVEKPNILFVVVDDLGWSDLGFMGNPMYQTPNLDRLATESVVFTNAYAPAANCAPSRACVMTGLNTPRHGIYTVSPSTRGKSKDRKLIPTPNTDDLAEDFTTIAEVLKKQGYINASVGKWHLSDDPKTQGFDVNVGGTHQGHPKSYFSPYNNKTLSDGAKGEYLTERLTSEAIQFMESNKEKPFFLYLPYYTVHTPLQGKKELIDKYKKIIKEDNRFNATYGAMVEAMDENIGRLLASLEANNLSDNTLVIFTSDNGGLASVSSQFPLRAGKGSYYEGGIRVPFMVKWPKKIKSPRKTDVPITGMDVFPTLLDVVKSKETLELDGASLYPLLTENKTLAERSLIWHFPIYLQAGNPKKDQARDTLFRTRPGSVIRRGNWKLHEYFEDGALELYNLELDEREQNDLSEVNPDKVKELHEALKAWRVKMKAPVPTELNPDYEPLAVK
ncbi:sulfatase [Snuella lapsa]|uniref:Sulfatase n=1 Tax=Snuella lapsa TaxID=870481 RepID=A0ABP6WQJ2_9FLAO